MTSIVEQSESITLNPTGGFVVKTKIISANDPIAHTLSTKVFINICHDVQVPKPAQDFDPPVTFPLIIDNQWEIPLIVSREKHTKDKKGIPSFVYDCCINTVCFQWCQINSDLRSILVEWCIESIELLFDIVLEREYSIPKMLSKGELSQTKILKNELDESGFQKRLQSLKKNETLGLIEELKGDATDDMDIDEGTGKLPDLMNISGKDDGTPSKPLIQEINDMHIDVNKKNTRDSGQKKPEDHNQPIENESKISPAKEKLNYSITFKKLSKEYQLLVKFECHSLCSSASIHLSYVKERHAIVLNNSDPHYCFEKPSQVTLDIPLPNDLTFQESHSFKSFYVRPEHSIYIYC